LYKAALILYFTCFGLYILFSRQPDFFDGQRDVATIHFTKDSSSGKLEAFAFYRTDKKDYSINAGYLFRSFTEGEKVPVIYETSQPEKGAVYSWWGYWVNWGEALFSIVLLVLFYQIAIAITKNPSADAQMQQLEYKPRKKRKYED
jgi:hypothetical protein